MNLTVRFFATLKDRVGASTVKIDVPAAASVESLLSTLVKEYPALEDLLPSVIVAVNQKFSDPDQVLSPGDEIVVFPPVSGG
ncbi:MAG: molybdopterin converting factor subunit 1 [Anaerolineales bacterium]